MEGSISYDGHETTPRDVPMTDIIVRQATTKEEHAALRKLRHQVFVREQGVPPELEVDELDAVAHHAIASNGDEVVGTGRLVIMANGEALIGRMVVRADLRRKGIGGRLLKFLEEAARALGAPEATLHAQSYVSAFYLRHGYKEEGEPFEEAGIQHILMRKPLT